LGQNTAGCAFDSALLLGQQSWMTRYFVVALLSFFSYLSVRDLTEPTDRQQKPAWGAADAILRP
jgi:hypothetical protein